MQPIPGYEEEYLIGEDGSVMRKESGRILRPSLNPQNGYLYVGLWKNNQGKTYSVHRLVAQVYLPNPHDKPHVNHLDSNRANPHKSNLAWCTQAENITHGYEYGFMSQESRRRFKAHQLDLLLETFLSGVTLTAIAAQQECGLPRLSINLRKHAEEVGLSEAFVQEMAAQKRSRNRQSNQSKKLAVNQYTLDGLLVARHESLTAAACALGKKSSGSISNALSPNHPQKKAYGFLWKYA